MTEQVASIFNDKSTNDDLDKILQRAEHKLSVYKKSNINIMSSDPSNAASLEIYVKALKKRIDPEGNKSLTERFFQPISFISDTAIFNGLGKIIPGSKPLWEGVSKLSQNVADTLSGTKYVEDLENNIYRKAEKLLGIQYDTENQHSM